MTDSANHQSDADRISRGAEMPPPLRAIHILTWMVGTAVFLVVFLALPQTKVPQRLESLFPFSQVFYSMLYGAAVGSIVLFASRTIRGRPLFLAQPGPWLILLHSLWVIVVRLLITAWPSSGDGIRIVSLFLVHLCFFFGYREAFTRLRDAIRWRIYFAVLTTTFGLGAAVQGLVIVISFFATIDPSIIQITQVALYLLHSAIGPMFLVTAVVLDSRYGVARDWLHWTGVVMALSGTIRDWVLWVWVYLLYAM